MGKLHSKHAAICKPRESPEGDSFVVNACLARKGIDDWLVKQKYYCTGSRLEQQDCQHKNKCGLSTREVLDETCAEGISDEHYRLEVALPPEKTVDSCCVEEKIQGKESQVPAGTQKQLQFEELECAVSVEEDSRQEWTFTLYDFDNNGKVTREDITSLLHTIYEVVDASVNHSPSSSKTLRVKLSVAPDSSQRWRSCAQGTADMPHPRTKTDKCIEDSKSAEKKYRALLRRHHSDHHTVQQQGPTQVQREGCQRHCVDENLERRNHYLDLAGIENYTSRFGAAPNTEPVKAEPQTRPPNQIRSRSHEPENGHSYSHHRRSQVATDSSAVPGPDTSCPPRLSKDLGKHALRSPKSHSRTPPTQTAMGRVMRSRGAPPPPALPSQTPPHQSSAPYRRHKQRAREGQQQYRALGATVGPVVEKEQICSESFEVRIGPVGC
ncbi:protein naked cuticle homolog 1 isoform X3 [Esox lucius]|uniref:protein naked cuticle homolog 1 isoform X3 n=1 Tax=Esox lucius TaxID=8010 RepID=UPI001476CB09|nr:protein naked cuticle homolog 1 isoform X3 [Esox lucius]